MTHSVVLLWSHIRRGKPLESSNANFGHQRATYTIYTKKEGHEQLPSSTQLTLASSVTVKGLEWKHVVLQSLKGMKREFFIFASKLRYVQVCYKQRWTLEKVENWRWFWVNWILIWLKVVIERLCFGSYMNFLYFHGQKKEILVFQY